MIHLSERQKEIICEIIDKSPASVWKLKGLDDGSLCAVEKYYLQTEFLILLEGTASCFSDKVDCSSEDPDLPYVELLLFAAATETVQLSFIDFSDNDADSFLFSTLLRMISNTIVSIKKLVDDGFDYQAAVLMRNLFEQYAVLLLSTVSCEKRKQFRTAESNESARQVWHEGFRNKHFQTMLNQYLDKFMPEKENVLAEMKEKYDDLCAYVHNNYLSLLGHSFSTVDEEGTFHINIWGQYASRKKKLYEELYSIAGSFNRLFLHMIANESIDINKRALIRDLAAKEDDDTDACVMKGVFRLNKLEDAILPLFRSTCDSA